MITVNISISANTWEAFEIFLNEARRSLEKTRGSDSNHYDHGSYKTTVSGEEEPIVPTLPFEYDLSYFGGDYLNKTGRIVHIPLSLIRDLEKEHEDWDESCKLAFERFTHFSHLHLIHWSNVESESVGEGQTQIQIDNQIGLRKTTAYRHARNCPECQFLLRQYHETKIK